MTGENAALLRGALAPYLRAGRRTGARLQTSGRSHGNARTDREQLQAARAWLRDYGGVFDFPRDAAGGHAAIRAAL